MHGSAGWPPLRTPRGLVEEYRLLVFPDNVGAGKRLFTEDARHPGFTVLESQAGTRIRTDHVDDEHRRRPHRAGTGAVQQQRAHIG
ncbi:MAG: hypothetical protein ACJ72A_17310 [Nocardioidaceae bacterium]